MKKVLLFLVLLISSLMPMYAQDTITLNVIDVPNQPVNVCAGTIMVIYAEQNCDEWLWKVDNISQGMVNPLILQSQVEHSFRIQYFGCDFILDQHINYLEPWTATSFTHEVWKRFGELITVEAVGNDSIYDYDYIWSTGATTYSIDVLEPGIYSCEITDLCGSATRTFIVQDNVEIYRSGVDPVTNKNRVLWQTTPEQSAYISNVKIERDGMVVGTVPYLDGQFLDNIGSENAARIYSITGIASDGTECPISSYQFGTFNTIISPDIANPSLMNFTWEDPFIEEGSPYSVIAYRIGRFNESTGEFIAIDQLSAQVHLGKYDMGLFNGDYGVVAAVFNDSKRDYEELAFSNRSNNGILGVGELSEGAFKVFPNPSNGTFTVEGVSSLTVYNTLGQVVATSRSENGKHTLLLATGVYFLKSDEGAVRRIVVE